MNKDFDNDFQKLLTEMVELAYEFVDNNADEVDTVYVIGLIENGYFFKSFYKINGQLAKSHKVILCLNNNTIFQIREHLIY